jgi:ribose-phosphate pyrophosphokinase
LSDVVVIPGPASIVLGNLIASRLNVHSIPVDIRIFSDGESKIRINADLNNKKCVVVQSTYPPVDSNILQALMIISSCYEHGALDVLGVIPYMGYARQDRAFLGGECITVSLIAKLFDCIGLHNLITVDAHSDRALSYFKVRLLNISSITSLANYALSQFDLFNPIVISPDLGGINRAKEFAKIIKSDFFALKKYRDRITGDLVIDKKLDIDVENRDVIIVDDMISSGGTILKAVDLLKNNKCRRIYGMCVHALADESLLNNLKNSGLADIISTNSIPRSCSKVDLSYDISKTLSLIL